LQARWVASVDILLKKSGSASPRRVFRKMLRDMIAADHLPDYEMTEVPGDKIAFTLRGGLVEDAGQGARSLPPLAADTLETARALAPGWDVYALEAEWRAYWAGSGRPRLRSADKAFLGFVRARMAAEG
jgi:hypothetical protein